MKNKSLTFLLLVCFAFLTKGCMTSQSPKNPPGSLVGQQLVLDGKDSNCDRFRSNMDQIFIYEFNHTEYRLHEKGRLIEKGSYQYTLDLDKNSAHLSFSYSSDGQSHGYEADLSYHSATSGTWRLSSSQSSAPHILEVGTFSLVTTSSGALPKAQD